METVVCVTATLVGSSGLLLLRMGELVLLRMVYDLVGAWRRVFGRADGRVCFVSICDGFDRQSGGWGVERAVSRAVWSTRYLSLGDRNLFAPNKRIASGDEFRAWSCSNCGACDDWIWSNGPDAA